MRDSRELERGESSSETNPDGFKGEKRPINANGSPEGITDSQGVNLSECPGIGTEGINREGDHRDVEPHSFEKTVVLALSSGVFRYVPLKIDMLFHPISFYNDAMAHSR